MKSADPIPRLHDRPAGKRARPVAVQVFWPLAATALAMRIVLAPLVAHGGDLHTFINWGLRLAEVGPSRFWSGDYWCDYLPGYLYVLWFLGELARGPDWLHPTFFKLPNLIADVVTAYLVWRMVEPTWARPKLWVPAVYLFNPAVLGNSTLWGQVDSFHALTLVGGLYLLVRERALLAAVVLGYAAAVKPHTVAILPLALFYAIAARLNWWRIVLCPVIVLAVFAATFVPFNGWSVGGLYPYIQNRIDVTMGQYGYASVNAMNLWYLLGKNWVKDDAGIGQFTIRQVGTALTCAGYFLAWGWFLGRWRARGAVALWEAASIVYLVTFLFVTRAHERHIFPFFAMITVVLGYQRAALVPYTLLSLTYCINLVLAYIYHLPGKNHAQLCAVWAGKTICWINLLGLPLMLLSFTNRAEGVFERWKRKLQPVADYIVAWLNAESAESMEQRKRTVRHARLILAGLLLFSLGVRLIRLNTPAEFYFDEVYHAYTAQQWVKGNNEAWLWRPEIPPEKDRAYEWTHPPLAKLIMADSMRIFGIHPWAWRLPAALLGTACVLLIYLVAQALFGDQKISLLAATFASLDTLPLVMSRIAMNDIYCVTFILCAVLAALHRRHVLAALAVGLALSCKWSALYTFPLLGLIHLIRTAPEQRWWFSRWAKIAGAYALLVPAVYLVSYTSFFQFIYQRSHVKEVAAEAQQPAPAALEQTAEMFVELQRQMWWYHTNLKAKHDFSSPAWQWPFAIKPVWYHTKSFDGAAKQDDPPASVTQAETKTGEEKAESSSDVKVANIYAAGNPAIWLPGVGAVAFGLIMAAKRRDSALLIVCAAYLAFWAPWLLSPRIMFLYHYLPSLPFLYIVLAWALIYTQVERFGLFIMLALAGLCFVVMYPYVTAVPMPQGWTPGHFPWQPG